MIPSKEITDQIEQTVHTAGCLIEDVIGVTDMKNKEGHFNFVTKYDSKVQSFLIDHFRRILPEAEYWCEEDGYTDEPSFDGYTFIIDPIDGTTNFICGFMFSAISVALAYRKEIVYGIVYNPFRKEAFIGKKGEGATLNGEPIHVVDRPLSAGVSHFGCSPYKAKYREVSLQRQQAIAMASMDLRQMGSAALGISYVACNRCVSYASVHLYVWDYAAGQIILEEAGGKLTDMEGEELQLSAEASVLGGTEISHKECVDIMKQYPLPSEN